MGMFKELRGPERLIRMGQWCVALLFAYFLTQIGASVIADLPLVTRAPQLEDFLDKNAIAEQNRKLEPLQANSLQLNRSLTEKQAAIDAAVNDYDKAKQSFDNWRQTRSSTELNDQNPEVIKRTKELDRLLQVRSDLEKQVTEIQNQQAANEEKMQPVQAAINKLEAKANKQWYQAERKAGLKSFFIRLAFVGPLLALAIWLFRRYRKSAKWPFVWGFGLFALASFFIELVPYLPSFGGYIRYGVGALLTFFGGTALIRALQRYLERKREEQSASQEFRKESLRYEEALTAISKNQCPSCDRTLLKTEGKELSYCMHCGLQLFSNCHVCHCRKNAFYHYCPSCGTSADSTPETASA